MTIHRIFALVASAAAIVVVLIGLYLSGSPGEQRLLRLDERRVQHLQILARAIDAYWEADSRLPQTLEQLIAGQRLRNMPVDPVSGESYVYQPTEPKGYRLCADFDRPSKEAKRPDFWQHESGTQCFAVVAGRGSTSPFRPPVP